jgi:hypothetical protein
LTATQEGLQLVELDNRRRTTIRAGHHNRYRVTELENGTLILEPVFVLTEDEIILRQHPDLEARIERSMRDPAVRTRRERPVRKD